MKTQDTSVHLGDGVVVVRRTGTSAPAIANVLGVVEKDGNQHLYLDRIVHKPYESELGGYHVDGAISSIIIVPASKDLAS